MASWMHPIAVAAGRVRALPCLALSTSAASLGSAGKGLASTSQPPRFYIPASLAIASQGAMLRLPPEEARHATKTLRLRQGDSLELCDGTGWVALAEFTAVDRAAAVVQLLDAPQQVPRSGWQWEVACACGSLKGGRSDWLVEKCAELGAAAFTPLITHRSPTIGTSSTNDGGPTARRGGKQPGRRRGGSSQADDNGEEGAGSGREWRWERVAAAAMKQCLRAHAMPISRPTTLQHMCQRIRGSDAALVGVAGAAPLHTVVDQLQLRQMQPASQPGDTGTPSGILCVGPEGDFTQEELEELVAAGAQPVGLGPLRLRAETAALAMLSFVRLHCH